MRRLARFLIASLALFVTACAMQPPAPRTYTVSEQQLAEAIASQFPFNSTMLEVMDVVVKTPRITLDPTTNRINTVFDLEMSPTSILGLLIDKAYKGGIDMSYGLRFEPADNSVRMTDVRVSRFTMEGTPDKLKRPVEKLGPSLAQRVLKDFALYRLRPEDLQAVEGWGYKPGVFKVVPGGLSITLEPAAR